MSPDEPSKAETHVSRRDFLHRFGAGVAGVAGIFGLGRANGLLGQSKAQRGYGSSPYGGSKEK